MTSPFQSSRLANLREKKQSFVENTTQTNQTSKPLTLMDQNDTTYQPSMAVQGGRTATRFLKGRIQRTSGNEIATVNNTQSEPNNLNKENTFDRKSSLRINDAPTGQLKLVLNDSPQFDRKKPQAKLTPTPPPQKRVLIQKKQSQQQTKPESKETLEQPKQLVKAPVNPVQQQPITVNKIQQNAIKQEDVQESKDVAQNQNQLVECPQGCGRKFNRKALEKHAKACKLVFMSKRKQFNSEAKRLTSQQQAALVKQNKLQEKKAQMAMTKGKGFDKTSDNWKAASEDFRSAIKAIKKEGPAQEQGKQQLKTVPCQYCQKPFAQVLLPKHLENCIKRKQKQMKDKKKTTKKK